MIERIRSMVRAYLEMLGIDAVEEPEVVLRDNVGSRWLGRWSMKWRAGLPGRPLIEIQRSVLPDSTTLEHPFCLEQCLWKKGSVLETFFVGP